MKKRKRSVSLAVILIAVFTTCFYCVSAIAEDLRVGVYSGIGQKGILQSLADIEDIASKPLENFSAFNLSHCDVVVWPHGRLAASDRARLWRVLLTEYVKAGGGLILTHDAAGGAGKKRGDLGENPLFGDIARSPGYPARKEKRIFKKAPGTKHPLAKALPDQLIHDYYDHMALMLGPDGTTVMVDEDGDPVVIAGQFGKGRVVVMGNLAGYKGVKKWDKTTKTYNTSHANSPLASGELAMMLASLKWTGETFHVKPILPIELETTLDATEARAMQAGSVKTQPIAVLSDLVPGNRLVQEIWDYAKTGPGANKWGTWFGGAASGPPYNMHLSTCAANQPLTSKQFEKSPVQGRFLFVGEAILSGMYAGILEWRLVDDSNNGYGIRLVYSGLEEKRAGYAFRKDSKERNVKIGDARHAIFKVTNGKTTDLATPESATGRLTSAKDPKEKRVPIRFERTEQGTLVLSIDGMVVARTKDNTYDSFTKLSAVMTTPGGRLGFDNPKLTGYFADTGVRKFAPRPWIVPEPKEMKKSKETFTLVNGAQFVVSDREKIDRYLLDEWIIPEIEGYYGIKMKAVTIDNVDKSKPAIYLGKSSNPAFRKVFDAKLKKISKKDLGPEGYAILITSKKAQAAGATERGTFWALQSLVQLIERTGGKIYLRGVRVKDWPDFKLRGGLTYLSKPQVEPMIQGAHRMIRFMSRMKFNAWPVGSDRMNFPSYKLAGYGCRWSFDQMIELFKYAERHNIEVIPMTPSLSHCGWKVSTYLGRTNPKLWQRMLDKKVLIEPLGRYSRNSLNPLSPLAFKMVKATTEDILDAWPQTRIAFAPTQDEISPPLNTHAPEQTNEDLLVEWIIKHHKVFKDRGVRMMMYGSYLMEAGKYGASSAASNDSYSKIITHEAIDRIPKDIILVDWYYGTKPGRPAYKYLRDKGFDVVAMPGSNYGYAHESVYHAAVEGKKAGLLGIIRHGHPLELYQNPRYAYSLPWIYGWTVPDKMIPDWNWQEDWQELYQGPQPSHTGIIEPVDISHACNDSRMDDKADDGKGWLDYGKVGDLRELPAGELVYKRYRFQIIDEAANSGKSVVITTAKKGSKDDPARKATIDINRKAKSLVFLHASSSMGGAMGWRKPGLYRVNYADGRSATVQLIYGHNIGPWIFSAEPGRRNNNFFKDGHLSWTRLAHQGRTAIGDKTGLYSYEWINPYPDKKITSVDMKLTTDYDVRVALVALSAVKEK